MCLPGPWPQGREGRLKLSDEPVGNVPNTVRRRRRPTRRHRRNRLIRRALLVATLGCTVFGVAFVALHYVSPSLFRAAKPLPVNRQTEEAIRNDFVQAQEESLQRMENRPVYPYSIIPGGVKDARELKWVADHDPVVRAHYAGFDYDHARMVRLVLAQTVYVSYRIGNKVYWTRHRVTLKKGETVLTDGKMTARAKCGNRVEEMPQQATSESEPPAQKFEEPIQPAKGTAVNTPPVPFQSALMNRPGVPGLGPAPPLSVYDPFPPGYWVPISPPPLPGLCGVGKPKKGSGGGSGGTGGGKKGKGNPCGTGGGGGGEVPEPETWLLVASGMGLIYFVSRRRLAAQRVR